MSTSKRIQAAIDLARQEAHDLWVAKRDNLIATRGFDPNDIGEVTDEILNERREGTLEALAGAKEQLGYPSRIRHGNAAFMHPRDTLHTEARDIYVHDVEHNPVIDVGITGHDIYTGEDVTESLRWDGPGVYRTNGPYLAQDHQMRSLEPTPPLAAGL